MTWARQIFSDDRRFWPFAAVFLGLVSFAKGIRVPSRYNATAAMIDYSHGLVKRGLFGATVGRALRLGHFSNFVEVSYLLLLALFATAAVLVVRRGVARRIGVGEPVAVFAVSFAVTYMADEVGLMDIPLAMLTMGLLLIRDTRLRFAAAIPACVIALLTHEMFLLVFLPVLLFSFLWDGSRGRGLSKGTSLAMMAALAVVCLGITVRLSLHAAMTAQQAQALQQTLQTRADFPLQGIYFPVFSRSTADNLQMIAPILAHSKYFQLTFIEALLVMLPPIGLLLVAIRRVTREQAKGGDRGMLIAAATVAALAPFAMDAFGYDFERFAGLVCWSSLMVLAVVCPRPTETAIALPAWYRNVAVLVIAVSMVSGAGLQDRLEIRTYPFLGGIRDGLWSIRHHHWDAPRL